jgi:MFS family permease
VPLSVGDSELRIVPSVVAGPSGIKEGTPLLFHWRWYYHVPSLPLWALIVLLLIVPKTNRDRRAWLILIPLVVVLLAWQMPFRLLSASDGTTAAFGFPIVTGVMAWCMVWLLAFHLGNRPFFLALAVMLAVGLLSYYSHFGADEGLGSLNYLIPYGLCAFIPLAAMTYTGHLCRKNYSQSRFLGRLIVWNILVGMGALLAFVVIVISITTLVVRQIDLGQMIFLVIYAIVASIILGGILYVLNLPFLVLAFKNPFYMERLKKLFHVQSECSQESLPPEKEDPA